MAEIPARPPEQTIADKAIEVLNDIEWCSFKMTRNGSHGAGLTKAKLKAFKMIVGRAANEDETKALTD